MKLHCWLLMGAFVLATDAVADVVNLEQAVDRALRHDARIREQDQLVEVARGVQKEAKTLGIWCTTPICLSGWHPKPAVAYCKTILPEAVKPA